jgi:hypothetical protein
VGPLMLTWQQYIQGVVNHDTHAAIAHKTGLHPSLIRRWMRWGQPLVVADVAAFAAGYQVPPLDALAAAGLVTLDHARVHLSLVAPLPSGGPPAVVDVAHLSIVPELDGN